MMTNNKKDNLKCPYCEETVDFDSLSKNDWGIEEDCVIVRCTFCGKVFKIVIKSEGGA